MLRIEAPLRHAFTQAACHFRILFRFSYQCGVERVQQIKLLLRGERGMIGDVVSGANEIIEGEDRRAMARRNQKGGDRKIFVAMGLSRTRPRKVHMTPFCRSTALARPQTSISRLASISSDVSNRCAATCARGA